MSKLLWCMCWLFAYGLTSAQTLVINGNIVVNETSPEGAKIVIFKNGVEIDAQTLNKKGHFELKLALGADYKINFEKTAYITKIVNVNTEVPEEVIETNPNFPPIRLIINLLPEVEEVDLAIFNQPIAILAYNPELDDFVFDKEYSDKIKVKIAQTEQQIKRQLTAKGAAALERERQFAERIRQGQQAYDRKEWKSAIEAWTLALNLKPGEEGVKQKIALARKEIELEEARRSIEQQNERAYRLLIASADSIFGQKQYKEAREKYTAATRLKDNDTYPVGQIRKIDALLAAQAQQEAEAQKQRAAREAAYEKAITLGDQAYEKQEYVQAIVAYREALTLKNAAPYPTERIAKAEEAINRLEKATAEAAEQKRIEEERRNSLKTRYAALIAEADKAFKNENYSLAKLRYTEADQLKLEEPYPRKQLQEINNIINSSKYKAKLAEYNKNKTLAEKNQKSGNYAAAKVYYQKALAILPVDKEQIQKQLQEIEKRIEAERLAALEKEYQNQITKADKAYREKSYAVAKFYYQKALEIKIGDAYANQQLKIVEKYIGERQEKEAEL